MSPLCDCVIKLMLTSIPPNDLLLKLKQLRNYLENILMIFISKIGLSLYFYKGLHFGYNALNWSKKLHNINV